MKKVRFYIFVFLIASIGGWIGEFIWRSIYFKHIVNPGALVGPFCPIYGTAATLLFFILNKKDGVLINLLNLTIVSTLVEYITAYISEEFFNNKLWSYSHLPLNFQGRVCLSMTLVFVSAGLFCFYFIKPKIEELYENHPNFTKYFNIIVGFSLICNIILQIIL